MYEGEHVRGVCRFPGVFVTPFSDVAKERGVPKWWGGLPVPVPWVPWEILDEPCFKHPVERGLLTWCRRILGNFESCPKSFLGEDSDWVVVCHGESKNLVSRGLDAAIGRDFLEFYHVGFASGRFEREVDPIKWGARVRGWVADPIAYLYVAGVLVWAPRDAGGDDVLASFV